MPDDDQRPGAPGPVTVDRRRLALLLVPITAFVVASNIGTILSARLVADHPAVLIALDARLRHLLLAVAADIDPSAYFVIGFLRLIASDPLFYLLGHWYGDAGLRWMERKAGGVPGYLKWIERWFPKAAWPLVALMPNNLICLLAGATRMRPRVFMALNAGGTLVRLAAVWLLASALEEPLDEVLDVVQRYQWPLTALLFGLVMAQSTRQAAKAQLQLDSVSIDAVAEELEEELQRELEAPGGAEPTTRERDADPPA